MLIAIIPARFASTRFPGKPLVKIGDKSMIQRVYEQVVASGCADQVLVATDYERILGHVLSFGGLVEMTRDDHPSGTDRCAEVALRYPEAQYILNIQGDEPFIQPSQIILLAETLRKGDAGIATLVKKITDPEVLFNPNAVKAVTTPNGDALFFSRHPIPYLRGISQEEWLSHEMHFKHVGLYGFSRENCYR